MELIDLDVSQALQRRFVLLQALRGDQPHEEPALSRVLGGIERGQLVAEGKVVAVGLDDLGDIFAVEGYGERGEWTDGRVAG